MTDAEILHYSIFGEEGGILISAGTGSICLVKNKDSNFQQIGGWGYLLGDKGSGFYIGNKAIKAALYDIELGKQPSILTKELLSFYGLEHPENLISVTYSSVNPPKLVASSAILVCELAERNEPNACRIVNDASNVLMNLALQAVEHYGEKEVSKYKIALTGSILRKTSIVNRKFKQKALKLGLNFEYVDQDLEPAAAGVLFSLKKCSKPVSDSLMDKLRRVNFVE